MTYDFRKADTDDLQSILELFSRAVEHLRARGIDQWDEHYPTSEIIENDINSGNMCVLCEDETIVSAIVINEHQEEEYEQGQWKDDSKPAVIHRLCVDPKAQSKGIGRRMMDYAERLINEKDYTSIRLDVFSQNPRAYQLYKNLGYLHTGEATFCKGFFYLMEKILN